MGNLVSKESFYTLTIQRRVLLSRVMKKAWIFKKKEGLSLSKALKKAWKWIKKELEKGKVNQSQNLLF